MSSISPRKLASCVSDCLLLTQINNCQRIQKSTLDLTPPSLVWTVLNHGPNAQADHPGRTTRTLAFTVSA
jgi:hypothetical protein